MVNKKLLFEIGVEDLPSKNLDVFSEKIKKSIEENFKKNSISFSSINNFYTNIRLVFIVNEISEEIILRKKIIKVCDEKIKLKGENVGLSFYAFFANKNDNPKLLMEVAEWWIAKHQLNHFEKAIKIKNLVK